MVGLGMILVKKQCENCNRRFDIEDGFCPYCGAYYSETREYTTHTRPTGDENRRRPAQPAQKKRNQLTIASVSVLLSLVSILVGLLTWLAQRDERVAYSGAERAASPASPSASTAGNISELYSHLDEYPRDFDAVSELVAALCAKGQTSEASEVMLRLYQGACDTPGPYRRTGEALLEAGNTDYAVRAFLSAHTLSGLQSDLDLAAGCGSPADIIGDGPTGQALAFLFGKPFSLVTWEEVGKIRYYSQGSSVSLSLLDPADTDTTEFYSSIQSFELDEGAASPEFFYGLRELKLSRSFSYEAPQLCALRNLRKLDASTSYGVSDFRTFSVLPSLEELYVGGSDITALDGLGEMPNLHTLGLTDTSIDNLSLLSTYKSIEHLSLKDNENLTGLSSLGQMDHLKSLSIEDQEVMDFQFLQKYYAIEGLTLIDTGIKDIYFISQLTTLTQLHLEGNDDLKSVAGIGALDKLTDLTISAELGGIEEIAQLHSLRNLSLRSVRSLEMVRGLTGLETLHLTGGGLLNDLSPVSGLTNLRSFSIGGYFDTWSSLAPATRQIAHFSLSPLASLPNLTYVSLPNLSVLSSSAGLFQNPAIEYLDLTNSEMDVGAGFGSLTNLKTLRLSKFKALTNIQVWSDGFFTSVDYDSLTADWVAGTLGGLENLERLELDETDLSDLGFVAGLPALRSITATENYVTDIEPLSQAPSLQYANLSGNPVRDWSPAEEMTGLWLIR